MDSPVNGYFHDDGTPVNPDLLRKPGLCVLCRHDGNPKQEILCSLTRLDQKPENDFVCDAFEGKQGA